MPPIPQPPSSRASNRDRPITPVSLLPSNDGTTAVQIDENGLDHWVCHVFRSTNSLPSPGLCQVVRSQPSQPADLTAEDSINARNNLLAAIPIPPDYPDESLSPIVIPLPLTLHEFISNAPAVSKAWPFLLTRISFLSSGSL